MRNGLPFSKPRVRLHGDPGEAQAHLGEAYGLLYKVRQFCERSGVPVFAMSRDLPGGGHVTAAVVGAEEIVSVYPTRYAQHIEEQELLDKEFPSVVCVWHARETTQYAQYPHGFYAVYAGVIWGTSTPSNLDEGYYSNGTNTYLGPIQLSGGGVWMGDFGTLPFPMPYATPEGYFSNPGGVYAGPILRIGGGRTRVYWALVGKQRVFYEGSFGPMDQDVATNRYTVRYSLHHVCYKGKVYLTEFPGSNDQNSRPHKRLSAPKAMRRYFDETYPSGMPEGVNPTISFDANSIDFSILPTELQTVHAAMCITTAGLHWLQQGPGNISRLNTSAIINGVVQAPHHFVDLLSHYSWAIATDGKHIAVGGWGQNGAILEVYQQDLTYVWHGALEEGSNDQPAQIGYEKGYLATTYAQDLFKAQIIDLRGVINGDATPLTRTVFNVGRWRSTGEPSIHQTFYIEACAVKDGAFFTMSAGRGLNLASNAAVETGECFVDVFSLTGEHVKTISLNVPDGTSGAFAGHANPFRHAMVAYDIPRS